jgi:hypothetical protein
MATYVRNIQGRQIALELIEVDPKEVKLDPTNPRVGFQMKQLPTGDRSDSACEFLLITQEETEELKRSIIRSHGVQEPIYIRWNKVVAEGNRRVVALRAAQREHPHDKRFATMPAWRIPKGTPEFVVADLLNEIHVGGERGWAPYEKALQMKALLDSGLVVDEVAERYRLSSNDVRQQVNAVDTMDSIYFPITKDATKPEHRAKFSYFLEFHKIGRLKAFAEEKPELMRSFAEWVRDGKIETGAKVRRLARVLESDKATRLLETAGMSAAEEYLRKEHPEEQELYALLEKARERLVSMTVTELVELRESSERRQLLKALGAEIGRVEKAAKARR